MTLNSQEIERYARHISLPNFGAEKQLMLKNAKVLIAGVGGLGCPAALYLSAMGVGQITLVDADVVSLSNLQRQVLFRVDDIGQNKAKVAQKHLSALNPEIEIHAIAQYLNEENILDLVAQHDIILDTSDNFSTRYLINDAAVLKDKIVVSGSMDEKSGQVSVFNYPLEQGRSGNYRDLYPTPPLEHEVATCAELGVLGILPGIIGNLMVLETVKAITKDPKTAYNQLMIFNSVDSSLLKLKYSAQEQNRVQKLEAIYLNCSSSIEINKEDLNDQHLVLDIRPEWEIESPSAYPLVSEEEVLIYKENHPDKTIVLMCSQGLRSKALAHHLGGGVLSLKGGIGQP